MPLPTPYEHPALIMRTDAIIEDTHAFTATRAAKLDAMRAFLKGIAQLISPPAIDRVELRLKPDRRKTPRRAGADLHPRADWAHLAMPCHCFSRLDLPRREASWRV